MLIHAYECFHAQLASLLWLTSHVLGLAPEAAGTVRSSGFNSNTANLTTPHFQQSPTITYNTTSMESLTFARLPAELRNSIWKPALQGDEPIRLSEANLRDIRVARDQAAKLEKTRAIMQTCSQIRNECALLFFHVNTLELDRVGTIRLYENLGSFYDKIGRPSFFAITRVVIGFLARIPPSEGRDTWSAHFKRSTTEAIGLLRSLKKSDIGVRLTLSLPAINVRPSPTRPVFHEFSIMLSFRDWEASWDAATEKIKGEIDRIDHGLNTTPLIRFKEHLPAHKETLRKLWNV